MIYPITPTTLNETEIERRPALREPTIAHCQAAYEHVYRSVLKKKKSRAIAGVEGSEAFIEALPPLIGLDNISNFIASVTYGVAVGAILEETGDFLLRAARCAMSAIALKARISAKTAQPPVAQPRVSQPPAAQPTVAQPTESQASASHPRASQSPESAQKPSEDSPEKAAAKSSENHNKLKPKDLTKWQFHASLKTNKLHPPKKSEKRHFASENQHLPPENSHPPSEIAQKSTTECP